MNYAVFELGKSLINLDMMFIFITGKKLWLYEFNKDILFRYILFHFSQLKHYFYGDNQMDKFGKSEVFPSEVTKSRG